MEQVVTDMFGSYAEPILALMGLIAALCVLLPAPDEESGAVYRAFYKIANWIGCNVGKAKNADDEMKAAEKEAAKAETAPENTAPADRAGEGKA